MIMASVNVGGISTAVVPLNGSNYATWKVQCKMALLKDNLWGIVSGTEEVPTAPNNGGSVDKYTKYVTRRDKALAVIVLSVDPSLLYLLAEPEDQRLYWRLYKANFKRKLGPTS